MRIWTASVHIDLHIVHESWTRKRAMVSAQRSCMMRVKKRSQSGAIEERVGDGPEGSLDACLVKNHMCTKKTGCRSRKTWAQRLKG